MLEPTELPEVLEFTPRRFTDARGWFMETWSDARWSAPLGGVRFVQDNQSFSGARHTLRGLHFQTGAHAQDKLVRVVRGAVLDVAVDIRPGSATFGRHVARELSAESARQLFIPKGFAHGFLTLVPDTEVAYRVSAPYAPEAEGGLLWCDPALGIIWPAAPDAVVIAGRDSTWPTLAQLRAQLITQPGTMRATGPEGSTS
jgi:dTDP-4-dehydrorhamnose 3,5-epimerase